MTAVKPYGDAQRWLTVILQAAYVAANASRLGRLFAGHAAFLAVVGFAAASAGWSVDPGASLSGAIRLFLLGASIFIGQDRHGGALLVATFRATCCALLLANLAAIAVPSISIMRGTLAGAFRGLTDHKNTLGQLGALALAFLLAPLATPRAASEFRALVLMALVALVSIALTRSATSALLAIVVLLIFAVEAFQHRSGLPILTGLLLAGLVGAAAGLWASGLVDPFQAVGRDATLTGRADIWRFVELYVHRRPWLGFGYRAFPLADLLRLDPRWGLESYVVGSTHNAYLAIVTETGYLGLAVYAAWLIAFVARHFPREDREARLLAAMVLASLSRFRPQRESCGAFARYVPRRHHDRLPPDGPWCPWTACGRLRL